MAMNRETKRMLQRQGQLGADGAPARTKPQQRPAPRPVKERTSPRQYLREVRGELRKVAWPTKAEVTGCRPGTGPCAGSGGPYDPRLTASYNCVVSASGGTPSSRDSVRTHVRY